MRAFGLAVLTAAFTVAGLVAQGRNATRVSAGLEPNQEVPVVLSPQASGVFNAVINDDTQTIEYELSFSGLQANTTQSHIHVAQASVNGAIVVWLCQTAAAPDLVNPQTQQCPLQGGTITGTIVATDIRAAATQGLSATLSPSDRFDRFVAALRAGEAYANVHSAQSPGGEIRGQIRVGGGHQ